MSSWSKCSKTCGSGHQIRGVFCSRSDNEPLNTLVCDGKTKPIDMRRCLLKECILKRGLCAKRIDIQLSKWAVSLLDAE